MFTRRRHRSCPPCVQHSDENVVTSACGVTCMIRCPTRDSFYEELHIHEDRGHQWALVERARDLLPLRPPLTLQNRELLHLGLPSTNFASDCNSRKAGSKVHTIHEPFSDTLSAVQTNTDDVSVPVGNAISQSSLDALGCAISKFAQSSGSGMGESTVSNIDSFPHFGSVSGTSGSDDKDAPSSEGGRSNSGEEGGRSNSGEESVDRPVQEITTLMICSIPFHVTSEELLKAMDSFGFVGTYDFLYMPSRTAAKKHGNVRRGNVGYAFVNFKNDRLASRFSSTFAGYVFAGSEKQVFVRPAVSQGLAANLGNDDRKRKNQNDIMLFPPRDIFQ